MCRRGRGDRRGAKLLGVSSVYPDETPGGKTATLQPWLLTQIQKVLDYVQDPTTWVFHITSWVANHILTDMLLPLQNFLIGTPWFVTLGGLTLIAYLISGLRPAVTTFAMLAAIGVMGVWALSMDTLSQVLVATVLAVVFGVLFGVLAAENNAVSKALRPVNDVLQTLPQLVYIIPFIYLMPVSIVPGIIAGVLYCLPCRRPPRRARRALIVAPEAVEAAGAFGATRRQILAKVKVPLAGDAIMLGVNQGIVMVLAVVVIGGLVGSAGSATRWHRGSSAGSSARARSRRSRSSRSGSRSTGSRRERGGHVRERTVPTRRRTMHHRTANAPTRRVE